MSVQSPSDFGFRPQMPEGDDRQRLVCGSCGWIHYVNPKIVVGAVISHGDRLLLCRRAIEPRRGFWTIPAGFMEERESSEEGAAREAREEACAEIRIDGLLGVYNIPRISQVQLIYRAELVDGRHAAGPESLESRLLAWDEIPWSELAFPTVQWALNAWQARRGQPLGAPDVNPPDIDPHWKALAAAARHED